MKRANRAKAVADLITDDGDILDKLGLVIEPQSCRFREALRVAIEYRRNAILDVITVDIPESLRSIAFRLGLRDNE